MTKQHKTNTGNAQKPSSSPEEILARVQDSIELVRTKAVDYSFNELFDMYLNEELIINPDYQRLFRWEPEKQSQFIESLILELPIPPIYVVEEEEGRYELIDGLQRFSSYLHFRGKLSKDGKLNPPLTLNGCDIVKQLDGQTYESLPTSLQIRLKRMSVPVQILRKESDRRLRYHMFKRLNTGGEPLSDQEVRNATIRLLGVKFNNFIQKLSKTQNFTRCVEIMTTEQKERMEREECVLRFFTFKNDFKNYKKLIGPFLDNYMERVTEDEETPKFDYENEQEVFEQTFEILARTTSDKSFSTVTKSGTLGNQFSMAHFDMITQGLQKQLSVALEKSKTNPTGLRDQILQLKQDKSFRASTTGGGKNYSAAYKKTITYVENWFEKCLPTV